MSFTLVQTYTDKTFGNLDKRPIWIDRGIPATGAGQAMGLLLALTYS